MSTMIETVARAICEAQGIDPGGDSRFVEQGNGSTIFIDVVIEPGMEANWRHWAHVARAAIEAMREPTPEMVAAIEENTGIDGYYDYFDPSIPYRAMISAALSGDA